MNKIKKSNIRFGDKLEYLIENHTITLEDGTAVKPSLGKKHTIPTILVQDFYRHGIFKYKNVVHDKNGNEKTHAQQCNDKKRIMQKHLDNEGSVSADWIMYYCHYFQCEPDFLFGYIDMPTHAITDACDYLKIDGRACEKIKKYPAEIKDLLNRLVLNTDGDNLLKLLQSMYTYADGAHHAILKLNIVGESSNYRNNTEAIRLLGADAVEGKTLPDQSKKMLRYQAATTFNDVLDSSYKMYIDDGNERLKKRCNTRAAAEKAEWKRLSKQESQTFDERLLLLRGRSWDSEIPTQSEVFKEIDEKYRKLYESNKEDHS